MPPTKVLRKQIATLSSSPELRPRFLAIGYRSLFSSCIRPLFLLLLPAFFVFFLFVKKRQQGVGPENGQHGGFKSEALSKGLQPSRRRRFVGTTERTATLDLKKNYPNERFGLRSRSSDRISDESERPSCGSDGGSCFPLSPGFSCGFWSSTGTRDASLCVNRPRASLTALRRAALRRKTPFRKMLPERHLCQPFRNFPPREK